eukprot:CAMPEP_0178378684 /NCGR_PEP_ID=MMETSP0689_2-20121128/4555_1 /TAXON_ID=160604 /ORGANISM="Amphidinium massartii, Strain CS-259" /LENGTH=418 /DNA_ID=CAMNT_0019998765 /DNA_START=87 /DNA_END=1343 /DNA_ORIENTATION=-
MNEAQRSTAVRLCLPAMKCPTSVVAACRLLSGFGDMAKVDVTRAVTHGLVEVLFFDVRSAEQCLQQFADMAEILPAADGDFRAVHVQKEALLNLPPGFPGFRTFGEVDRLFFEEGDMVVEYFDMRPAQHLLKLFPGSRPRVQVQQSQNNNNNNNKNNTQTAKVQKVSPVAPGLENCGFHNKVHQDGMIEHDAVRSLQNNMDLAADQYSEKKTVLNSALVSAVADWLAASDGALSRFQTHSYENKSDAERSKEKTTNGGTDGHKNRHQQRAAPNGTPAEGNKEVSNRAKAGVMLAHLEIQRERILNGEETRTTIMIRHIPKSMSCQVLRNLLVRIGLENRCTVLCMPTDKGTGVHSGFAFVDFTSPEDVLVLCDNIQGAVVSQESGAKALAVSYARIQGQLEIVKHFHEYLQQDQAGIM